MIAGKQFFIILGLVLFLALLPRVGHAFERVEYIKVLDITVAKDISGDIKIVNIGRHGPFRRYSWFRVGDVIEAIDGVKTGILELREIDRKQDPKIRFRRGMRVVERQISLETILYGDPPYLNFQ